MPLRLDAIGVVVADMARSLAFYRRLGLEVPPEADAAPHAEAELGGGVRLMWDTEDVARSVDPRWTRPRGGHAIGLAVSCATPDEVDRTFADLVGAGAGVAHEPWDAPWGQRYATVLDPDGNAVDLYAALPEGA